MEMLIKQVTFILVFIVTAKDLQGLARKLQASVILLVLCHQVFLSARYIIESAIFNE